MLLSPKPATSNGREPGAGIENGIRTAPRCYYLDIFVRRLRLLKSISAGRCGKYRGIRHDRPRQRSCSSSNVPTSCRNRSSIPTACPRHAFLTLDRRIPEPDPAPARRGRWLRQHVVRRRRQFLRPPGDPQDVSSWRPSTELDDFHASDRAARREASVDRADALPGDRAPRRRRRTAAKRHAEGADRHLQGRALRRCTIARAKSGARRWPYLSEILQALDSEKMLPKTRPDAARRREPSSQR